MRKVMSGEKKLQPGAFILLPGCILSIALILGCVVGLWVLRASELRQARKELYRLSLVLAGQTALAFQDIDAILNETASLLRSDPRTAGSEAALHKLLRERFHGLLQGQALLVFGPDGWMLAHSREYPTPDVSAKDREYFRVQQQAGENFLFISPPLQNRVNNHWMISLSRRLSAPDGGFGGVIMAAVEMDYFTHLYRALELPPQSRITLQRADGPILCTSPFDASLLGRVVFPCREPGEDLGVASPVPGLPLSVCLTMPQSAVLDGWRRQVWLIGAGTLAAVLGIGVLTGALAGRVRREWNAARRQQRQLEDLVALRTADLKQLLEFNETILEASPVGIGVYRQDGLCVSVNESFGRIVGGSKEAIQGLNFRNLATWRASGMLDDALTTLETGIASHCERLIVSTFGRTVWLEWQFVRFYRDETAHLLLLITDVSQRKQSELELLEAKRAAEDASLAKSEFLANMSHDIRTPINGVMGMLQLIQTTSLDAEQQEYVAAAMQSTRRLTALLSDILDLSRIEAGKLSLQEAAFEVDDLKDSMLEVFSLTAREKGLGLDFTVSPGVPRRLLGDEARIRQILFNLVGNALKFTSAGSVQVELSTPGRYPDGRLSVLIAVHDTGIGIPDDRLEDLFEAFVQGEGARLRSQQGAGLGLSIVRRLVRIMGGELAVDNHETGGTTIYCCLPLKPDAPAAAGKEAAPALADAGPLRLLLVDDEAVNLLAAQKMLEKAGYAVTPASSGREVLELLAKRRFDCILLDVLMPGMDGLEVTRAIRTSPEHAAAAATPIIAVTAYAMSGDREKFLAAGMDDYIAKPIDMERLRAAIARATAGRATPKGPAPQ